MEIDSQELTPPGSPILGYSGMRDSNHNTTTTTPVSRRNEATPILTFSCKGSIFSVDKTFSPQGFFCQNEVPSVISNIIKMIVTDDDLETHIKSIEDPDPESSYVFFGFDFQPFKIEDLKVLISMSRKRIAAIENLARRIFPLGQSTIGIRQDQADFEKAFLLRQQISSFFRFLIRHREVIAYANIDFEELFHSLIISLGKVSTWSSSLQFHCGSKTGNLCSSPEYHLFHLHWEIRWALLVILKLKDSILNLVLDDLIQLSHLKFRTAVGSIFNKNPFNCYCIKELWTMLKFLIEKCKSDTFWETVTLGVNRLGLQTSELLFPIWLMSYLAQLSEYEITGELKLNPAIDPVNNYTFLNEVLKDWFLANPNAPMDKLSEVNAMLRQFLTYWGLDNAIVTTLWSHWHLRIDKGFEVRNMSRYSSASRWLELVTTICDVNNQVREKSNDTNSDPFFGFLSFIAECISNAAVKDWRKIASTICNRMSPKMIESLSENGLIRLITTFLCMTYVAKTDIMIVCEKLNEALNHVKDKEILRPTKFRGRCAMILLLLQRCMPIGTFAVHLMKSVDEIMGSIHRSPSERDLIMVYLDLVSNIPKYSPDSDLDQSQLISQNLTPWMASCGTNYLTRTFRILHTLFQDWILSETVPTIEKSRVGKILLEKTEHFLQQSLLSPKFESVDVEPYAELGVDLTIYQKSINNLPAVKKLFQLFGLSPTTFPKLSEIYVDRLLSHFELSTENCFTDIQMTQCWIRLVVLGAGVPVTLSAKILSSHCQEHPVASSTSNEVLLRHFCAFVNSSECFWTKAQLTEILSPVGGVLKVVVEKDWKDDIEVLASIVRYAVLILRKIKFENIYTRNSTSTLVHQLLEGFIPSFLGKPPWEKLPSNLVKILGNYLHKIFVFIDSTKCWMQDPFLRRKLCDVFRFGFLGFITTNELDDGNPGLLMMRYIESQVPIPDSLLNEVIPSLSQLAKEENLTKRFIFSAQGYIKRGMMFTNLTIFGILLELMIDKDREVGTKCITILTSTILSTLSHHDNSKYKPRLLAAFEIGMNKHFAFRSKKFFDFFNMLANYGQKKPILTNFVLKDILPILTQHIKISEAKQGTGSNYSMRNQLQLLEANLKKTMDSVQKNS